jgi:UDP-3-O-[3-hydroxymyristoyl] glucosamine N-acyltransferase
LLLNKETFSKLDSSSLKGKTLVVVDYPVKLAWSKVLNLFAPSIAYPSEVHHTSIKGENLEIEEGVYVGPYVVIGNNVKLKCRCKILPFVYIEDNVEIGEETLIYSFVVIRSKTKIGSRVIIHPGVIIGADGFGYLQEGEKNIKIPQIGGVIIEDDVEIGANTTIDRGTVDNTIIKAGTKIDNLVQVAHNVKIGENCIIVSQTGIAGSVNIGNNVVLGGQIGIKEHVNIADRVKVGAKSGITKDINKEGIYSGFPAKPHHLELRMQAVLSRLAKKMR